MKIQIKSYIELLRLFYKEVSLGEYPMYSSACYEFLVNNGKVAPYDSDEAIQVRKQVYKELAEQKNEILIKIKKERPDYYKNTIIRMRAQSILVNNYLKKVGDFEKLLIDLKFI